MCVDGFIGQSLLSYGPYISRDLNCKRIGKLLLCFPRQRYVFSILSSYLQIFWPITQKTLSNESVHTHRYFIVSPDSQPKILLYPLKLTVKSKAPSPRHQYPELRVIIPAHDEEQNEGKNPNDFEFLSQAARLSTAQRYQALSPQTFLKFSLQFRRDLHLLVLPQDLCEKFLPSGRQNTKKRIGKCGVLCGALEKI